MAPQGISIVAEFGGSETRLGFSKDPYPTQVFPTVVRRVKTHVENLDRYAHRDKLFIGDEFCPVPSSVWPVISCGSPSWHHLERVIAFGMERLNAAPREHGIVLPTKPCEPISHRERMGTTMFEFFETPAVCFHRQDSLALQVTSNNEGCVVVDVGEGATHVSAHVDGFPIEPADIRLDFGGANVTQNLATMLSVSMGYRGMSLTDVADVKEAVSRVAQSEATLLAPTKEIPFFELPDGQVISVIDNAHTRCIEQFFSPERIYRDCLVGVGSAQAAMTFINPSRPSRPEGYSEPAPLCYLGKPFRGIQDAVASCIETCDQTYRETLARDVLLLGGPTLTPGFCERFKQELHRLPGFADTQVTAPPATDRQLTVWKGGALLAESASSSWLYKSDFDEVGPNIFSRGRASK